MVRRKGIKFVVFLLSHFRLFMPWQMFVESLMLTILDDMITLLRISSLIKGWGIATCLAHFRIPRRIVAALHAQYLNDLTHYHANTQWIGRVFFQSNTKDCQCQDLPLVIGNYYRYCCLSPFDFSFRQRENLFTLSIILNEKNFHSPRCFNM